MKGLSRFISSLRPPRPFGFPGPLILLALLVLATPPVPAQEVMGKRPLPIDEYKLWRNISGAEISPDGHWVGWSYSRVRGDDTLHVQGLVSGAEHVVPLGSDPAFSDDGKWVAYFLNPTFQEAEKTRREDESVSRKVELLNLTTGDKRSWDDGEAFEFSRGSSHLLVRKESGEEDGADLILRNLIEGYDELLGSVDEAEFNRPGTYLAYTVATAGLDGNGLFLVNLETGARRALDNAKERYSNLSWAEEGDALAVLRGHKPDGKTERENVLLAYTGLAEGPPTRHAFNSDTDPGLPDGWVLSEKGDLQWATGLETIFVGIKEQEDALEDWPEDRLPLADVNIWHWADDQIQTAQMRQASREGNRTYMAAIHLDEGRMVPLADESMRTVEVTRDGRWAMGRDETPFVSDWKPSLANYYRIDTRTGERRQVLRAQERTYGFSPDGRHYLYWLGGHFFAYRPDDDLHVNLTASTAVDFTDLEFDRFGDKPPYGVGGWSRDGGSVLLNHRYDVWAQPLDGTPGENLTQGRGHRDEIRFRYLRTDPEERSIDLERPLLFSAFGEWTKKAGFFELRNGEFRELAFEDKRFGSPRKASGADRYLFTMETFQEFPDLWVSDGDFQDPERITEANPQQEDYIWGHRILFEYTNDDGVRLQGTLAIPDTWEEGRKLPMVVRFYEKDSQNLHAYPTPSYGNRPNFAGFVSNGYLIMQPDIYFRVGSSHSDMLECVEAATRKVIELGYADPEAIGLQGGSYSGGGSAYIATRSDMFAAVVHRAAPINLVSEFNQLFVGSGQNNHQYDIYGQGRYGTNPYDDFQLYWDQSPISGVENMNTPVLYLHGEADPTVNWEQGLEWYNALRFLGKPIIWLSYPGEGHSLRRLENQIDFQYRMRQFFDHYLKGAPAPEWMTDGVPFLEKEEHLRDFAPTIFERPDTSGAGHEPTGGGRDASGGGRDAAWGGPEPSGGWREAPGGGGMDRP